MSDLHTLTLSEAAKLIAARALSPVELTHALLERVHGWEPHVNAFVTLVADQALAQARAAEQEIASGHYRGPLHGIPIGVKDVFDTAGIRTTGHSRVCMERVPHTDAAVVEKLKSAGAVLMGKLATHEFAHGGPSFDLPWPPARNPWNLEYFTGGSSSGPAAAVAAGFVLGALGSDTGGSIRGPASYCGVAGMMPTCGVVSRFGVMPNSFTLDRCGPLARTVLDCALLMDAIAGYDPRDAASVDCIPPNFVSAIDGDIRGVRVGVVRHFWEEELRVDEALRHALDGAVDTLRGLGASVEDCSMAPLQAYRDVKMIIGECEILSVHLHNLRARHADFGADFLGRTLPACLFQGSDYVQALRLQRRLIDGMAPLYARYDVLVTAAMGPAPRLQPSRTLDFWRNPNITTPFNVTGSAVAVTCIGFSRGMPLGMQIAARPFGDAMILKVADAYQRATHWHTQRPQLKGKISTSTPASAPASPAPDPHARALVETAGRNMGLSFDGATLAQACSAVPYVMEMKERVWRAPLEAELQPATVLNVLSSR